ncbi:uncharacterized protein LOC124485632 isoform X2 [Hypomesus transpacificus]|uniref:uncharacterized protein LOC124485632 isoform X1 n=1 Tax=Hypomesus transpacificus TaxID=137520 RepID=UPI001F082BC6|nr:uncharacterized protein LOC124485632 isoform X1 [Hypomesus transpacificus]XP_046903304.1 uncharacterized protein LOC124485632 isoform X2 [Hypomesus transpacificus]
MVRPALRTTPPPLHSPALGEEARGASSPLALRHAAKSPAPGPAASLSHRTASLSHAEQNGHGSAPPRWDDRGFNAWGAGPRDDARSSPRVSRKLQNAWHRADGDPSLPAPTESLGVLSRSERGAALERRMRANGLSAPGQPRLGNAQRRGGGRGGAHHIGAVQMTDGSASSGSESSDSEAEGRGVTGGYAPGYGHAVSPAPASSPALPRNRFSFGSLQLDEEMGEEGCLALSDEDGAQVFSC